MARPTRHNWEIYKDRFVRGGDDVTLKSLSDGSNAPAHDTLRKRAAQECWQKQREEFRHNSTTKTRERAAESVAEVRSRHADLGKAMTGFGVIIMNTLKDKKLEELTIRDAVRLLQVGADIERRALGMDTFNLDLRQLEDVTRLSDQEIEDLKSEIQRILFGFNQPDKLRLN